jgi:MYXO-CTERM domain-containing protein
MKKHSSKLSALLPVLALSSVFAAGRASAAIIVVTPGEQNTASNEFQCSLTQNPCPNGRWRYYPELLQTALGTGYTVKNAGDGGAILGCDTASATLAGNASFCKSNQFNTTSNPPPDIVVIGPFGEHDQRILAGNAMINTFYMVSAFQAAYEGLIAKYTALKATVKIYMMTPIDVPFNATALGGGKDIVKDVMNMAARNAAMAHNIPIIDTYTAITAAAYPVTDGQVNAAGQMKMAMMIEDALMAGGTGGAGGAGGAGGGAGGAAGGAGGGAGGAGGATGAGGGSGGTGMGVGSAGTMGGAGTAGTAGASGSTGSSGTAGSTGSSGTAGSTGESGSTGSSGTAGSTGSPGTAGTGTTGTGTGTGGTSGVHHASSGGCTVAAAPAGGALGLAALGVIVAAALGRRRRR